MIRKGIKTLSILLTHLVAFQTMTYAIVGLLIEADRNGLPKEDIRVWVTPPLICIVTVISRFPLHELRKTWIKKSTWKESVPILIPLAACLIYILLPLDITVYTVIFFLCVGSQIANWQLEKAERKRKKEREQTVKNEE